MTAWSGNGNQFTLRIYDKGGQVDVYQKQFAWYPTVVSNMQGTFNEGVPILANDKNKPYGPYFLRDPLIVLPPGVLQIQITNVQISPILPPPFLPQGIFQILFGVAIPRNTIGMQNRIVQHNTDQTGTQSLGAAGAISGLITGGGF